MNTLIDKPANADSRILKVSALSADQLKNHVSQPAAPRLPPQDDHQVDNGRSLQDVMEAITTLPEHILKFSASGI